MSPRTQVPPVRLARLRVALAGIGPEEADFARRGFSLVAGPRARLETVGHAFVYGYRAALADDDPGALECTLAAVDQELRGFGYEGAAMGVMLRDLLAPWRRPRLDRLLAGPGAPHLYMVHVGAGWAFARLRRRPRAVQRLDPLLRWLALDGYGFHQGYFQPARYVGAGTRPRNFVGYAARAFDQGLGRSLWFVAAAQPHPIADAIARFDVQRRPDLWSGVALAATYAGAAEPETLRRLAVAGAGHSEHLAQGAPFAAAARETAANPAAHTELACRMLAGVTARDAAALVDHALRDLPPDSDEPAYEVWRRRVRIAFAGAERGCRATRGEAL